MNNDELRTAIETRKQEARDLEIADMAFRVCGSFLKVCRVDFDIHVDEELITISSEGEVVFQGYGHHDVIVYHPGPWIDTLTTWFDEVKAMRLAEELDPELVLEAQHLGIEVTPDADRDRPDGSSWVENGRI